PHGDSTCPCQDGDPCHYEDDPASGTVAMNDPVHFSTKKDSGAGGTWSKATLRPGSMFPSFAFGCVGERGEYPMRPRGGDLLRHIRAMPHVVSAEYEERETAVEPRQLVVKLSVS